jgi:hypothetical protein
MPRRSGPRLREARLPLSSAGYERTGWLPSLRPPSRRPSSTCPNGSKAVHHPSHRRPPRSRPTDLPARASPPRRPPPRRSGSAWGGRRTGRAAAARIVLACVSGRDNSAVAGGPGRHSAVSARISETTDVAVSPSRSPVVFRPCSSRGRVPFLRKGRRPAACTPHWPSPGTAASTTPTPGREQGTEAP